MPSETILGVHDAYTLDAENSVNFLQKHIRIGNVLNNTIECNHINRLIFMGKFVDFKIDAVCNINTC